MLSVVIEAFKKSVIFPPYTFRKSLFVIQATGLYITLHSLSVRLDGIYPVQIHLIGIPQIGNLNEKKYQGMRLRLPCKLSTSPLLFKRSHGLSISLFSLSKFPC